MHSDSSWEICLRSGNLEQGRGWVRRNVVIHIWYSMMVLSDSQMLPDTIRDRDRKKNTQMHQKSLPAYGATIVIYITIFQMSDFFARNAMGNQRGTKSLPNKPKFWMIKSCSWYLGTLQIKSEHSSCFQDLSLNFSRQEQCLFACLHKCWHSRSQSWL